MNKIKWIKLKNIAQLIVGKEVNLFLSTLDIGDNIAICENNHLLVNIYFNAGLCKSINEVIEALAHELAHVTVGDPEHDEKFTKKWREYIKTIRRMYYDKAKM